MNPKFFLIALSLAPLAASAADVFHSPENDGVAGPAIALPDDGSPVHLFLYIDGGPNESAGGDKCTGDGDGDELCGWDVAIVASDNAVIDDFLPASDVTHSVQDGIRVRAVGGDSFDPHAVPQRIGTLTVSAVGDGRVEVIGNLSVGSRLAADPIPVALLGQTGLAPDSDGDGIADDADNCTDIANADQRDTNGDGYGNACDADLNNDGLINFGDLAQMKADFLGSNPDADLNGDGLTNFGDLAILKGSFLGSPGPSGVAP